jgi:hypothetical protein
MTATPLTGVRKKLCIMMQPNLKKNLKDKVKGRNRKKKKNNDHTYK